MWLYYAILSAFIYSLRSVVEKKYIQKLDKYILAFGLRAFALVFFLTPLIFNKTNLPQISQLSSKFWLATLWVSLISSPMEILLYYKALQIEEVSFLIPLLSAAPIFTTFFNFVFFKDFPTTFELLGVVMIVLGVYTLNIKKAQEGIFEPFKHLSSNRAVRYMSIMILLYSLGVVVDKIAVVGSSPYIYSLINYSLVSIALFVIAFLRSRHNFYQLKNNFFIMVILGLIVAGYTMLRNLSLQEGNAGYVSAVLSSSVLFTTIISGFYLKEREIKLKFVAGSVILAGLLLLKLLG